MTSRRQVWHVARETKAGLVVFSTWSTADKAERALARYRRRQLVPRTAFVSPDTVDGDAFSRRSRRR